MRLSCYLSLLFFTFPLLFVVAAKAAPLPGEVLPGSVQSASFANPVCTPAACDIIEGILINLPFLAISGDVVLIDPDNSISDVVRFFNDVIDTGGGTGLGTQVFMYSKPDGPNDLSPNPDVPFPTSLSVNAVRIAEAPVGQPTIFNGNGTIYSIYSDVVPEPSTLTLGFGGLVGMLLAARIRKYVPIRVARCKIRVA